MNKSSGTNMSSRLINGTPNTLKITYKIQTWFRIEDECSVNARIESHMTPTLHADSAGQCFNVSQSDMAGSSLASCSVQDDLLAEFLFY